MSQEKVEDMTDDDLLMSIMTWFRIGRNEGTLHGTEREKFRAMCAEAKNRELLREKNLKDI